MMMATTRNLPSVEILGVPFAALDPGTAVAEARALYESDEPAWIAVENVHALNIATAEPSHREVLRRADLVLNDGKGVMLGARILGRRFPADLHGNRFTPLILDAAARNGWRVFLLGGAPGVVERAAERLAETYAGLEIAGTHHGFFAEADEDSIGEKIAAAETGLLLVGMGMPLQERWLDRNLHRTRARLGVTVGAFFDFQAGVVPRAPSWMNRLGVEWVFRLVKEPRRLWRRYLIGNPLFLYRVLTQRIGRHGGP
jgi:exopolysaccharide biosynthesis WecB/TagA/CpsF family protein